MVVIPACSYIFSRWYFEKCKQVISLSIMRIVHFLAAAAIFVTAIGCARKTEVIPEESRAIGDTGGRATLRVTPMYYEKYLDYSRVYIKYDATSSPNSATKYPGDTLKYSAAITVSYIDGLPRAVFTRLKKGNYYIFTKGVDAAHPDTLVGGGAAFRVVDTTQRTYDLFLKTELDRDTASLDLL
jgi:hypothetical protein